MVEGRVVKREEADEDDDALLLLLLLSGLDGEPYPNLPALELVRWSVGRLAYLEAVGGEGGSACNLTQSGEGGRTIRSGIVVIVGRTLDLLNVLVVEVKELARRVRLAPLAPLDVLE